MAATIDRTEVLRQQIADSEAELQKLQQDAAMTGRKKFATDQLNSIRNIVKQQKVAIAELDAQVLSHLDALVVAVESGHEQNGHFFQLTAAGQRGADAASVALKNIVTARFHAKAQLLSSEARLVEQEAFFSK